MITQKCKGCGVEFRTTHDGEDGRQLATICGKFECVARTTWPKERWESQLRMAISRALAGVPTQQLDLEAIRRLQPTLCDDCDGECGLSRLLTLARSLRAP